jgi:hypothetical protein
LTSGAWSRHRSKTTYSPDSNNGSFGDDASEPPLAEPLTTLRQLREQDLDPDPPDNQPRIRKGTVEDRRVSVQDKDMRHGRKSKSKRFNGYKVTSPATSTRN